MRLVSRKPDTEKNPHAAQPGADGVRVILMASILFGLMAVCVRVASREVASTQIAFFRFAGAFLVLLAIGRGRRLRPRAGNLPRILLRGFLGAGAIVLYFRGIQGAGAGLATLLHCTYPVYTALFATTLLGEPFGTHVAVALALNVLGACVLLGPTASLTTATATGALWAVAASVFAGGAVVAARQLRATETTMLITTYFMAIGAVCTAPSLIHGVPAVSLPVGLALAATVAASVGAQLLLHQGLGFTGAIQGSLAAATTVVSATLFEAVLLRQLPSANTMVGAATLLGAVFLAARGHR